MPNGKLNGYFKQYVRPAEWDRPDDDLGLGWIAVLLYFLWLIVLFTSC